MWEGENDVWHVQEISLSIPVSRKPACLPMQQGDLVEEATIFRSVAAKCLAWHPELKIVAIGWRSGEITTYNHIEDLVYEQGSIHRSPVNVVKWNQNGTRLISGDKVARRHDLILQFTP